MGIFRNRNFWKDAVVADGSGGLGFSEADWSFTTVESRCYPVLRASANGPVMGGQ
jgi:hypothetical protein